MTKINPINSAHAEPFKRRVRRFAIGLLALTATAIPVGASATEHASKLDEDRANLLPLPEIPYLESMQWMRWKPSEPLLKIDTLVLPNAGPALLWVSSENDRSLPSTS